MKLTLDRNVDMSITGQRHAFYAKYKASLYNNNGAPKLGGMLCELYSNAGCALDLSGPVSFEYIQVPIYMLWQRLFSNYFV